MNLHIVALQYVILPLIYSCSLYDLNHVHSGGWIFLRIVWTVKFALRYLTVLSANDVKKNYI